MSNQPQVVDAPAEGPWPIYDTDHLKRRIDALAPDRKQHLAEAWQSKGWGELAPLLTAEEYKGFEELVNRVEEPAPADFEHHALAEKLYALPPHIAEPATEALAVYAGMANPRTMMITGVGRLAEIRRIVNEACEYDIAQRASVANGDVVTVADLPPADDQAEQIASEEYPGAKAKAETVLAWVGDDLNRAARAYALEQDRPSPRKGISAKLTEILGADGLAKVNEALAAAAPPPLDLGAPPPEDGNGAAGADEAVSVPPVETPAAPAALPMADALDLLAAGFTALADAVREVA